MTTVKTIPLPRRELDPYSKKAQEFEVEVPVGIDRDTFVFVEAGDSIERLLDSTPHDGPLGAAFPLVRVLAFSNALLVTVPSESPR